MRKTLSEKDFRHLLERYETSYLYMDQIDGYAARRSAFLSEGTGDIDDINSWLSGNVPYDRYTRITGRTERCGNVSLGCPAGRMVSVRMTAINDESVGTIISMMQELRPCVLILDLRGSFGNDMDPAMKLAAALTKGTLCVQRFRSSDRTTVSNRDPVFNGRLFVLTDIHTKGCAEYLASVLYLNAKDSVSIGKVTAPTGIGCEEICLGSLQNMCFMMASYRWYVEGEPMPDGAGSDRFVMCTSHDDHMHHVLDILREEGWPV